MPKLKTTAQFIQDARKIHGDKYDYSESVYINKRSQIKIICPVHGSFWQTAGTHAVGKGCRQCADQAKSFTLEQFLALSRKIHGDRYDYSQAEYVNVSTKVKIVCPIHGVFLSRPEGHIRGNGCPSCAHDRLRKSQAGFIADAIKIHGNTYDYSLVEYLNFSKKVKIACKHHGVFEQTPRSHITGSGCPKCFGTTQKSLVQFIKEAQSVHGEKYNYSETNYTNTDVKVKIICPIHGVFRQTPYQHTKRGNGCPLCSTNGLDYNKQTYLYLLLFEKPIAKFWKVGITNLPIEKRFSDHRFIVRRFLWQFDDGWQAESLEKIVLKSFAGYALPPNPNLLKTGYTECFDSCFPVEIALPFIDELAGRIKQK